MEEESESESESETENTKTCCDEIEKEHHRIAVGPPQSCLNDWKKKDNLFGVLVWLRLCFEVWVINALCVCGPESSSLIPSSFFPHI